MESGEQTWKYVKSECPALLIRYFMFPSYRDPGEPAPLPQMEEAQGEEAEEDVAAVPPEGLPCGHHHAHYLTHVGQSFKGTVAQDF